MKKVVYILFLLLPILFCNSVETAFAKIEDNIFEKNAYRIVRKVREDGTIVLSYIFPLNTEFMEQNFTEKEFENYKLYLTLYVNALSKKNKENEVDGVSVSGCAYYTDIDGIGFSVTFKSADDQQKFFGVKKEENQSLQEKKTTGFFVKKTSIKTEFPVSTTKVAGDLKMVCVLAISSWSRENNINEPQKNSVLENLSKAIYIYDFAITQSGLKSQKMYSENGFYHNVFTKSIDEVEQDNSIYFYTTSINRGLIYIFVVVFVCLGVLISLLIVDRKKKKKKI